MARRSKCLPERGEGHSQRTLWPRHTSAFLHHGQVAVDGRNVAVFAKNQKAVPCRVLQIGPGDLCRVAFQAASGQGNYEVFYGGEPPAADARPAWTATEGLLLETHEFRSCNMNDFNSVREAFNASKRIGSDYVDGIRYAGNPFNLKRGPFLSRYSGMLRIPAGGTYGFMTTSQD